MKEYERLKNLFLSKKETLEDEISKLENELSELDNSTKYTERQKMYLAEAIPSTISRKTNLLNKVNDTLEFLRPDNPQDRDYRNKVLSSFNKEVCSNMPSNLHLLFHGTSIYAARHIIESQAILSPEERGVDSDITAPGQIWVTSKESSTGVETTLTYANLGYRELSMPAGCIFVITGTEEEEMEYGKNLIMPSFSFKENPEKIFSIITTPENYELVQQWCEKSNIDINKVKDFESFIQVLKEKQNENGDSTLVNSTRDDDDEVR